MAYSRMIYVDQSKEFWPEGWMVWACIALGLFDFLLLCFILLQLFRPHGG